MPSSVQRMILALSRRSIWCKCSRKGATQPRLSSLFCSVEVEDALLLVLLATESAGEGGQTATASWLRMSCTFMWEERTGADALRQEKLGMVAMGSVLGQTPRHRSLFCDRQEAQMNLVSARFKRNRKRKTIEIHYGRQALTQALSKIQLCQMAYINAYQKAAQES